MSNFNYRSFQFILLGLAVFVFSSCKDDEQPGSEETGKYSALLCVGAWPNTAYYIANIPSLTSGTISLQGNGAELTGKVYAQDVIQKNGYYYHANFSSGRLGKYHVENGVLLTDKEVPFTHLDWSSYVWADDQTLVIFGTGDNNGTTEARYAVVKVNDMSISTGKINLEAFPQGFANYSMGFAEYRSGKIFLGYAIVSDDWSQYPDMPVNPRLNVAVISYPAMTVEGSLADTRSTTPGGPIVYAPASFQDEHGDIYFITDPVFNYDYNAPSSVYRIKNGSTELDPSYYFNFSSKVNNQMGAAMWYIGDGKAIVRTRAAGQSIDADHYYSVINVQTGTFLKKLDLPVDKGERMVKAVLREGDKVYIAVNAEDRDYIWEYDPTAETLTPGAEFIGGIDFILRLEKTE